MVLNGQVFMPRFLNDGVYTRDILITRLPTVTPILHAQSLPATEFIAAVQTMIRDFYLASGIRVHVVMFGQRTRVSNDDLDCPSTPFHRFCGSAAEPSPQLQ
jgi:hypothetical protein